MNQLCLVISRVGLNQGLEQRQVEAEERLKQFSAAVEEHNAAKLAAYADAIAEQQRKQQSGSK